MNNKRGDFIYYRSTQLCGYHLLCEEFENIFEVGVIEGIFLIYDVYENKCFDDTKFATIETDLSIFIIT